MLLERPQPLPIIVTLLRSKVSSEIGGRLVREVKFLPSVSLDQIGFFFWFESEHLKDQRPGLSLDLLGSDRQNGWEEVVAEDLLEVFYEGQIEAIGVWLAWGVENGRAKGLEGCTVTGDQVDVVAEERKDRHGEHCGHKE